MSLASKQSAALKQEGGKLKKFFAALKKLMAKEFLWIIAVLLLAIPLAFLINHLVNYHELEEIQAILDQLTDEDSRFTAVYAVSVVGIYFSRTVFASIKTLVKKEEAKP